MIHIIRHKEYDFEIPSGYCTCEVGKLFKGGRDNINALNPVINELTGIYDVWKNYDDVFVGFCHYHRFFAKDGETLGFKQAVKELSGHDIILAFPVVYPDVSIRGSLERDFREDLPTFDKYMDLLYAAEPGLKEYFDGNTFHPRNMFFTDRTTLNEYCEWVFNLIIPVAERFQREDFNKYPHYYSRMIGFIAERLLTYYVKSRELDFTYLPYKEF